MRKIKKTKIDSLIAAFKDLRAGDALYLDLDNTVILNDIHQYQDKVRETEKALAKEIRRVRDSGVKVYALTARQKGLSQVTESQLASLNITFDEIIHAPTDHSDGRRRSMKGEALLSHLDGFKELPKRIIFGDDLAKQHDAVSSALQGSAKYKNIPLELWCYSRPAKLSLHANDIFPETLSGYSVYKSLGGGTNSTYLLTSSNPKKPKLVLKYGAHPDAMKLEILCNELYRVFGVKVLVSEIYRTLPEELAKKLNLSTRHGMFQVSEYIESAADQSSEYIQKTAQQDFMAHVLLGNIDIAKEDQFIVDKADAVYLVDVGSNFIFRALGEDRKESSDELSELQTLRDAKENKEAFDWFGGLSEDEINNQANAIVNKLDEIEKVIWEVSEQLEIPDDLREIVINAFAGRLESLAYQTELTEQLGPRIEKPADAEKTAAGILTYTMIEGKPHVLLSKRVRHEWWDNFGGKSDQADESLLITAAREVKEESSGDELAYTSNDLEQCPFHDLISEKNGKPFVYRMYIAELKDHKAIDLNQLQDSEHTDHQWVPLSELMSALKNPALVTEENKQTIKINQEDKEDIILYPELYQMLQQQPVRKNLDLLASQHKLKKTHTQGHCDRAQDQDKKKISRRFTTTDNKRREIAENLVSFSHVLRELKEEAASREADKKAKNGNHQDQKNDVQEMEVDQSSSPKRLSPSELHLKAVLKESYDKNNIRANVTLMLEKHFSKRLPKDQSKINRLINEFVEMLNKEKADDDQYIHYYHACDSTIAFAYEVYTKLYETLKATNDWPVFRAVEEVFKAFPSVVEFINYFSRHGKQEIDDHDVGFADVALCANPFLFGNHNSATSCSIYYLLANYVGSPVDLNALLSQVLAPFNVSQESIAQLTQLYEKSAKKREGALFQISLEEEEAEELSYAAESVGVLKPYECTHSLVDVLDRLQALDSSSLADEQIRYIKELQARLMLPPDQAVQVKTIYAKPMDENEEAIYKKALTDAVDFVSKEVLKGVSKFNTQSLSEKLPLFHHKNALSQRSVLPVKSESKSKLDLFTKAILANNEAQVIKMLSEDPNWIMKELQIPKKQGSYFKSYQNNQDDDAFMALEFILEYSRINAKSILTCVGDDSLGQMKFKKLDSILLIIAALPETTQLAFVTVHADKITNGFELAKVLEKLESKDRLDFSKSYVNKITNGDELAKVLKQLESEDRLDFAKSYADKITNGSELAEVLEQLAPKDRLDFAKLHADKITNWYAFKPVLEKLESKDRLDFAKLHADKITNWYAFKPVLEKLESKDRLDFAKSHADKIRSWYQLAKVLEQLESKDHLDFVTVHADKITNGSELATVLKQLESKDCSYFATVHMGIITNGSELAEVLEQLESKDRLDFANMHAVKITHGYQLPKVLKQLESEDRLDFAKSHADKITNGCQLAIVLKQLEPKNCLDFAKSHADKITNGCQLAIVLEQLEPKNCLDFAKSHADKIRDWCGFQFVFEQLESKDRLSFAKVYADKITKWYKFQFVFEQLESEDRLSFAKVYADKITKWYKFQFVFEQLESEDRLSFAKVCADKITNWYAFKPVLEKLESEDRLDFAKLHMDTITDGYQLAEVLEKLESKDRLDFSTLVLNKLNIKEAPESVLACLSTADQVKLKNQGNNLNNNSFFAQQTTVSPSKTANEQQTNSKCCVLI